MCLCTKSNDPMIDKPFKIFPSVSGFTFFISKQTQTYLKKCQIVWLTKRVSFKTDREQSC